ncbi:HRDC domain-containing protein [Paenibacillus lemnae]|uniref:Helicase n=1 Tax=Paenibacillus lemnae TaxID=1330551 RepID=A0A848M967_PAELE|nr:HRDC domain-containing protein [Paenibacillus lemnae]NMO96044.1 helicase [Paenibacillus lemnae]
MQIVFMNQMSRTGSGDGGAAQVWIGEEEGIWQLGWRETGEEGDLQDESWYEGGSWQELLCVYRHGLAQKLGAGYRPVIEGVFHESDEIKGRNQHALKLQCYSELHSSDDLYSELCSWRRKKAAAGRKAPYFIASNRVLRMISAFVPHTREELLQLPGIGSSKAEEHGEEWLELTGKVTRSFQFPLDWVDRVLGEEEFMTWQYKQKEQKYKQELEHYRMSRLLLAGISEGLSIEELSSRTGLTRRAVVEALEDLEKEGYDTEVLIQSELVNMPESEQNSIWQSYEELGDTFLKPVLQRVYGGETAVEAAQEELYERLRLIRIRFRREQGEQKQAV